MTLAARSGEIPEPTVKSGWEKACELAIDDRQTRAFAFQNETPEGSMPSGFLLVLKRYMFT
jgi:hypothetical protein